MSTSSHAKRPGPAELRARWGRLLKAVLPAPDPNRLVPVTEVSRAMLPLIEGSLADVDVTPVLQEISGPVGNSRFRVLVNASQRDLAAEVVAGV